MRLKKKLSVIWKATINSVNVRDNASVNELSNPRILHQVLNQLLSCTNDLILLLDEKYLFL